MNNEVKITEFDLIDDVPKGGIVKILNQIADRAWNQNMGNWFVSCIDRATGRYYAEEWKDEYVRYIRNACIILPAQQKAYLIGDIRDLLVRVFQASKYDLAELGMPEVKITTSNVNSVLLSMGKKMWQHEWEADFLEFLDRRMNAPRVDRDNPFTNTMSGAEYDRYLSTITDSHNLDILHEILTVIIAQIGEHEEVRDGLDADNFFLQENIEPGKAKETRTLREDGASPEKISSIESLISWLKTKSKKINGWLADQVDTCWDRLGASEYQDTFYSYTTNVINALSLRELRDLIDYVAEVNEGEEDENGNEYDFGDSAEVKDLDNAREILKRDFDFLYRHNADLEFLLDELDAYIDRPESYRGEEDYMGYPTETEVDRYIKRRIKLQGERGLFDAMVRAINDGYFYDYDGNEFDEDVIAEMNQLLK